MKAQREVLLPNRDGLATGGWAQAFFIFIPTL